MPSDRAPDYAAIMLERLLPKTIDNAYRGHPLALWVFVPITSMTLWRSLVHMFRADGGAESIATIPLGGYPEGAATAVVVIFALWGLSQLLMGFAYVAVLLRYRAFLPFMYLLLLLEYVGRMGLGLWKGPIETLSTPPGASLNLVMIATASVMLLLSLRAHGRSEAAARRATGMENEGRA